MFFFLQNKIYSICRQCRKWLYNIYIYIYIITCIYNLYLYYTLAILYTGKSLVNKMQGTRESATTRITPHTTAVNIALSVAWGCTYAGTTRNLCIRVRSHNFLCIYVTKHKYNRELLDLWQIFEWMIHIASSAHQWVTFRWCQWYHWPVKVLRKATIAGQSAGLWTAACNVESLAQAYSLFSTTSNISLV